MNLINVIISICILCCIDAHRVLVFYPFAIRSINMLGEQTVRHLIKAGHEVTYVTSYPLKNPPKNNFTQVDISSTQMLFKDDLTLDTTYMMDTKLDTDVYYIQQVCLQGAILAFNDTNLQKFLDDTSQKFDLVLSDFMETELYAGLAALYDCPLIWFYSMGPHSVALRQIGESANPAYAISYLTTSITPFTFWERVQQLWAEVKWHYYKQLYTYPEEAALYKKIFGPYFEKRGKSLPAYQDLLYSASLVFSNEHHSAGNTPPLPLNFKFIGGVHVEKVPKPLPKDLQSILDNAEHGVIYFSLGSTWKSKDIPKSVKEGLLKLFGELKQTVVWKYEEELPNLPSNLHIVHWAPQQSILAHPNVRFFITHGGHLGTTEALHFGVPIIGIPVYFDQHTNIRKAVKKGYALTTSLDYNLHNTLRPLIQEMLNNPNYGIKAKEVSWIYHHRPASPDQELVHWVEHVIHTRGAPHLRSPALYTPFYQLYFLDLALIIVIAITVLAVSLKVIVCRKSCKTSAARREKKQK